MPEHSYSPRDLTRTVLAVLCIGGLLGATVWIVRPFLSALLWATMVVISTWPLLLPVRARLGQKRGLAVAVMTLALLLLLLIPLSLAVGDLISNMDSIVEQVKSLK